MNVTEVSNGAVSLGFKAHSASHIEVQKSRESEAASERHHHRHEARSDSVRPRALNVFRQELKVAFEASFKARFTVQQPAYAQVEDASGTDDVARETLGAARQLVADSPTKSAKALISFRAKVHETATYVQKTLGAQDDVAEVKDAVAKVDAGLDELETDVARNQESVATALEINTRTKQRSTIKIRTQEGDIVKLSIRRSENLQVADASVTENGKTSSTTEIEISSRSRLTLSVEGDLNDEELAAIRNVFAQAEDIAEQFFGGDLQAAFDLAAGFEFDTEQLARVKLRFRSYQSSSIAYTETTRAAAPPLTSADAQISPITAPRPVLVSAPVLTPIPDATGPVATASESGASVTSSSQPSLEPTVDAPASTPAKSSLVDLSAFNALFDALSGFLRSVGEGFERADETSAVSFRYHYSESFKLTLLLAAVNAVAPEDSADETATVSAVIGTIAELSVAGGDGEKK
jgi:hypothetical protein